MIKKAVAVDMHYHIDTVNRENIHPIKVVKTVLHSVQASCGYKAELMKLNENAMITKDCKLNKYIPDQEIQTDLLFWYCQPKYKKEISVAF